MSTVDLALARRRERLDAGPPPRPGWRPWLLLAAYAGCWAMFGYGLGDAAHCPVATGYLAPELQPPNQTPALLWMLFVGVFAGMLLGLAADGELGAILGGAGGTAGAFAINLGATALGLWRGAADRWTAPPAGLLRRRRHPALGRGRLAELECAVLGAGAAGRARRCWRPWR
ncbi:hypothetical protein FE772_02390 [Lysobacter enzymogenes]|nr:hypothetical protein [Lysobacter enzymogenes]QCW24691.1 hypothetical protein FE772_02390 [Lysobacter enzymogenes]